MKEDEEEVARQIEILNDLGQEWKDSQEGKLGKAKGKGRSGGRAPPKKDRLRELQARGEITPEPAQRAKEVTANMHQKLQALEGCATCTRCQWSSTGIKGCKACLGQLWRQLRLTRHSLELHRQLVRGD